MSKRVNYAIAAHLCGGRPCPHHLKSAEALTQVIEEAKKLDREEEAQKALDRIVDEVVKNGTHAV